VSSGRSLHYQTRPDNLWVETDNLNYSPERAHSVLSFVLEADFAMWSILVQRLLPYHFNYNELLRKYKFNESLACVQRPQQFRILSPSVPDPLNEGTKKIRYIDAVGKGLF
jgi:hypothetical protein